MKTKLILPVLALTFLSVSSFADMGAVGNTSGSGAITTSPAGAVNSGAPVNSANPNAATTTSDSGAYNPGSTQNYGTTSNTTTRTTKENTLGNPNSRNSYGTSTRTTTHRSSNRTGTRNLGNGAVRPADESTPDTNYQNYNNNTDSNTR